MNNSNLKREVYKTIKHMNNAELTAYIQRVWQRGYDAGLAATEAPVGSSGSGSSSEEEG